MDLQQLRHLVAVVDNGLDVSPAAEALCTSQPGIGKQIRLLEEERGAEAFLRYWVCAFIALFAPRYGRGNVDALLGEGARA